VGAHGQPVFFNQRRAQAKASRGRETKPGRYDGFAAALKTMGAPISATAVKKAVATLYPAGCEDQDQSEVLRDLFRYFRPDCQNHV
jgi:hypothetical protein